MTNFPTVMILLTTWFPPEDSVYSRADAVWQTLISWRKHLQYEGVFHLHVADDGSTKYTPDYELFWRSGTQYPVSHSGQHRHGVGASLNAGLLRARKESINLILYAVDDWSLQQNLDITPWARLLLTDETLGAVRLGPPHPNLEGRVEHLDLPYQDWGMRLKRTGYAFSHRPTLFHMRFFDAYGTMAEDTSALECERLYNENFCRTAGPDIMLALPHPWKHIDSIELADVEPRRVE